MTTVRDICTRAVKELQLVQEGESPSAETLSDALTALNGLFASWHNQGLLVFYPPGRTWRGDWAPLTGYVVDDAVARNGATYYCSLAHTSSNDDLPGSSPNWATYWTLYAETPMTLASTFPLDASHERGVIAMMAVEIAPQFGVTPSALTLRKASDGMTAIFGQFFRVPTAQFDTALTRSPSRRYYDGLS